METQSPLTIAISQIEFARNYTKTLLAGINEEDWFAPIPGKVTHLAWQVGHLAMAQYGLCLFRQRGRHPADSDLMSSTFRKQFSKGSVPSPNGEDYPPIEEILAVFERVYAQVMKEAPAFEEASLCEKIPEPYAAFDTKLGALLMAAHHEMLHAGQIGLIRRLLGKEPVR